MTARIHETALIDDDVAIGDGSTVWDNAHIRSGARVGKGCIVGDKCYIGPGVVVGDLVKLNTGAYLCTGVSVDRGAMISAYVVFTNDRYPRATTADLGELLPSEADESTLATRVHEGATIGAAAVIGPGLDIGRFAMIGMGSVVTRSVLPFTLVVGNPAKPTALVCRCGHPIVRDITTPPDKPAVECQTCGRRYLVEGHDVVEAVSHDG
jgi:UDP-2-acetamido-3-amino-2,3-dideoxy-glucuronate N-acetyltransferase